MIFTHIGLISMWPWIGSLNICSLHVQCFVSFQSKHSNVINQFIRISHRKITLSGRDGLVLFSSTALAVMLSFINI